RDAVALVHEARLRGDAETEAADGALVAKKRETRRVEQDGGQAALLRHKVRDPIAGDADCMQIKVLHALEEERSVGREAPAALGVGAGRERQGDGDGCKAA